VKLSGALNDVLIKNRSWLAAGINQMRELALIPVVCLLRGKGLRPSDYPRAAAPALVRMNSRRLSPLARTESVSECFIYFDG
jgi:hypothetical protein